MRKWCAQYPNLSAALKTMPRGGTETNFKKNEKSATVFDSYGANKARSCRATHIIPAQALNIYLYP